MWVQGSSGLSMRPTMSQVVVLGSIALWVIGVNQDYLKGVMEHNKMRLYYKICSGSGVDKY